METHSGVIMKENKWYQILKPSKEPAIPPSQEDRIIIPLHISRSTATYIPNFNSPLLSRTSQQDLNMLLAKASQVTQGPLRKFLFVRGFGLFFLICFIVGIPFDIYVGSGHFLIDFSMECVILSLLLYNSSHQYMQRLKTQQILLNKILRDWGQGVLNNQGLQAKAGANCYWIEISVKNSTGSWQEFQTPKFSVVMGIQIPSFIGGAYGCQQRQNFQNQQNLAQSPQMIATGVPIDNRFSFQMPDMEVQNPHRERIQLIKSQKKVY